MTERMFHVVFPDGEEANIYARGLSGAYGPAEAARRSPDGYSCFGPGNALDAAVECAAEYRGMPAEAQIEAASDLDFRKVSLWLMGPDERLLIGDLVAELTERGDIAQGFFDRQSQETWAAAKLVVFDDKPEPA